MYYECYSVADRRMAGHFYTFTRTYTRMATIHQLKTFMKVFSFLFFI